MTATLAGCDSSSGDPLQSQLQADIADAESISTYEFRRGFVSRWDNLGKPTFASCIVLGDDSAKTTSYDVKIYPHGGGEARVGLGDDYAQAPEWRKYCRHPVEGSETGTGPGDGR